MRRQVLALGVLLAVGLTGCAGVGGALIVAAGSGIGSGLASAAVAGDTGDRPEQHSDISRYLAFPDVALLPSGGTAAVVAISSDAALVAIANTPPEEGAQVTVWDLASRSPAFAIPMASTPRALAFATGGQFLAVGRDDGTIELFEATSGKSFLKLPGHAGAVRGLSFSPDDSLLLFGGEDGSVHLWDLAAKREVKKLDASGPVRVVAFSGRRDRIAASGSAGIVLVWDAATGAEVARLERKNQVCSLAFFPGGDLVATNGGCAGGEEYFVVWDVERREMRRSYDLFDRVTAVAVSPDGKSVAGGAANGRVESHDASDGERERGECAIGPAVAALAYSGDGKRLVIVGEDGGLYVVPRDGKRAR
jgi:WD40 repeat protein